MSLFLDEDTYTKLRKTEILQRFLTIDEVREKGNQAYNLKDYQKAIVLYTQALSLLEWLEYTEEDAADSTKDEELEKEEMTEENNSELDESTRLLQKLEDEMSRVDFDVDSSATDIMKGIISKRGKKASNGGILDDNLRPELKKFMATFDDNNVKIGEDVSA